MSKTLPLALIVLVALSGCVSLETGRVGREIARDLERDPAVSVDNGFSVRAGRGLIGTSRFLARLFAPKTTADGRRLARHVRAAQVAQYSVRGATDLSRLSRPGVLNNYREDDGWYRLATVRDSSGTAWIMYREVGEALRDLLTVVVSPEDLIVTKVSGDLTELVLEAADTWTPSTIVDDVLFPDSDAEGVVAEDSSARNEEDDPSM